MDPASLWSAGHLTRFQPSGTPEPLCEVTDTGTGQRVMPVMPAGDLGGAGPSGVFSGLQVQIVSPGKQGLTKETTPTKRFFQNGVHSTLENRYCDLLPQRIQLFLKVLFLSQRMQKNMHQINSMPICI